MISHKQRSAAEKRKEAGTMIHEITRKLAGFVVETRYPDIPEDVLNFAKGLLLKTTAGWTKQAVKAA